MEDLYAGEDLGFNISTSGPVEESEQCRVHHLMDIFMDTTDNTFDGDGWITSSVAQGDPNA